MFLVDINTNDKFIVKHSLFLDKLDDFLEEDDQEEVFNIALY